MDRENTTIDNGGERAIEVSDELLERIGELVDEEQSVREWFDDSLLG